MVQGIVHKASEFVSRNSPQILTGIAAFGVVSTAVMASKASYRACKLVTEAEVHAQLSTKEKVKLCWKEYIPATVMAGMTVTAVIMSSQVRDRRAAAMVSAYTIVDKSFREYREKVAEVVGEKQEKAVREKVVTDKVHENPPSKNQVLVTGDGDVLCYDAWSGRYFKSSHEKIRRAENEINHQLLANMWVSLNELYEQLKLPHTKAGEEMGWNSDNLVSMSMTSMIAENNKPCLVINFDVEPRMDYYRSI